MSLNAAQQKAASHHEGPCMVLAGPGSGKTLTITKRIEYLIHKYKVRPEEILVITFTKYAANEMKHRFQMMPGCKGLPVTFGTFHGIYYGILKWAYRFTSSNILSEEEKIQLLKQILLFPEIEFEVMVEDEQDYIKELSSEIGKVKNELLDIDTYISVQHGTVFNQIYKLYETQRKKMRKVDFDDMLVLCYNLFRTRPDILELWQKKFKYILVDEFQDVNKVQYDVLKMLAAPENNLFVVGDDDQSIYEFRGAKPEIMLGFEKDFPGTEKILLDVNYRSAGNIMKGALRVIGYNKKRFPKKIRTQKDKGESVHIQEVKDLIEESKYVIKSMKEYQNKGIPFSDMAILYRTQNDARVMAEKLMEYQIPFRMKEHIHNIYEHFIARNLKSYLRIAQGERDRRLFIDIMNCPTRYISRESLESQTISFEDMKKFYCDKEWMLDRIDQFEWDIKMMEKKTPYAAIQYVRKRIGYDDYLKEYAVSHKISEEDLFEILYEIEERAKEFKTTEEWLEYIEEYTRKLKFQNQQEIKEGVSLMTMHGAKGLEFDVVFIIEANDGVIPYKKAKLDSEIEEERRMFYVAMTRAKRKLFISYVKKKNGKEQYPSRFVQELLKKK